MTTPIETELKLSVAPRDLAQLRRNVLLKTPESSLPKRRLLHSIYYDTPKLELMERHLALRLRKDGKRWIQTLKGGGEVHGGLHCRSEWETVVTCQRLDFSALANWTGNKLFRSRRFSECLQPIFVTKFWRTMHIVHRDLANEIEFCIDRGVIKVGETEETISEIELELLRGTPTCLFEMALELQQSIPLRPEMRGKAERGYQLFMNCLPVPVKSQAVALSRDVSLSVAFKQLAFSTITHLQANEREMLLSEDIEYVHQMRVAIRRLRSLVRLFEKSVPKIITSRQIAEIKWLGKKLGYARDWDVLEQQLLPEFSKLFPGHRGIEVLMRRCAELRRHADLVARETVRSDRYVRLLLTLALRIEKCGEIKNKRESLDAFVDKVLCTYHKRVEKLGNQLTSLGYGERHKFRIAVKKLRYALDFFSSLYPKKQVRIYSEKLQRLQDVLGGLNDITTMNKLLSQPPVSSPQIRETLGMIYGWQASKTKLYLRELESAWKNFRRCKPLIQNKG